MKKDVAIIGAGFSGLSAACSLAKEGYNVTIFEKNKELGGRARSINLEGFHFDMGPTWYWMPDVFENFFNNFGKKVSDYYTLERLDPGYGIYFGENDYLEIPKNFSKLKTLFEDLEPGSAAKLEKFLKDAEYKYQVGINELVYKPGISLLELASVKLIYKAIRLNVFQSFHSYIRKYFSHPKIIQILEFPILFLGAMPENTPALYSLMNYADIVLGTWYPKKGMSTIPVAMGTLAKELGVELKLDANIDKINVENGVAKSISTNDENQTFDIIIGSADYNHVEQQLLDAKYRTYTKKYWEKRTMAPSSLIFYLGVNKKLKKMGHHNLFCDEDLRVFANEIYTHPKWPTKPLFYTSCSSKTDPTTAPDGCENLYVLMPVAPGIKDTEEIREKYYNLIMERIERITGENIKDHVIVKKSYSLNEFVDDYNSFKGNAYGLANTLFQTANLKPSLKSKKVKNLFFTGQLTVPGPGIPPTIISGQVVAKQVIKEYPL
ncbi:MAG: phytoene desaturase [Flavobacteriales bacterium]|nr:phytoene desaturase [Flavobacteriales bacterium]